MGEKSMIPEETSIYQIFVRNFTEEGTFAAAAKRLEGIRSLGFDWVYLTPVQPIGRAGRKGSYGSPYAIADYRSISPVLAAARSLLTFRKPSKATTL
jgi:glycosidase